MSNTATTALMAPICLSIAQGMGADPRAVLMACVIGGSCAYVTPIGMPANTMVVGAGNYKFIDYAKSGLPLIVIAVLSVMRNKRYSYHKNVTKMHGSFAA